MRTPISPIISKHEQKSVFDFSIVQFERNGYRTKELLYDEMSAVLINRPYDGSDAENYNAWRTNTRTQAHTRMHAYIHPTSMHGMHDDNRHD